MKPIVGLTPDEGTAPGAHGLPRYEIKRAYADAVIAAGGTPIILAYAHEPEQIEAYLSHVDGLVVTGGAFDVPPALYDEDAREGLGLLKEGRTAFELALLRGALARELPLLGVCGGMQLLNVALGGSLYQDIGREVPGATAHEQAGDRRQASHAIAVEGGTLLARLTAAGTLRVNSTHHQAVKRPGEGLAIAARAPDGVVEAIELSRHRFALGVQWHPELLVESVPAHLGIYRGLVSAAADRGRRP